jgi:hypothetical protein
VTNEEASTLFSPFLPDFLFMLGFRELRSSAANLIVNLLNFDANEKELLLEGMETERVPGTWDEWEEVAGRGAAGEGKLLKIV